MRNKFLLPHLITLIVLMIVPTKLNAQISIGKLNSLTSVKDFEEDDLKKLKSSTTVFLLPETNSVEDYTTILNEVWTFNEFQVVDIESYDPADYRTGEHIVASIEVLSIIDQSTGRLMGFTPYLAFKYFNRSEFKKKYSKLSPKAKKKKKKSLIKLCSHNYAHIYLSTKIDVWQNSLTGGSDEIIPFTYSEDNYIYNFGLGFLYNDFKQINDFFEQGESSNMLSDVYSPILKDLEELPLYIPESSFESFKRPLGKLPKMVKESDEDISKMLDKYPSEYTLIPEEELNAKILSQERILYLKYTRLVGSRILEIIDSSNGESLFRTSTKGIKINLDKKLMSELNKAVKKAAK